MENFDILKLLYDNKGNYISGEDIGKKFNVTRAAISRRIEKIKESKINIISSTYKGYMLKSIPDLLTSDILRLKVKEDQIIGRKIETFKKIDSTNEYGKKIAKEEEEGTIIISECQTGGKGRRGRDFLSEKGGIYFSIILKPSVSLFKVPFITEVAAVSVFTALEDLGVTTKIKWPNDIILNDKKLCGILCEMSCEMDYLNYVVCGIGVNVENKFDDEVNKIATSLKNEGFKLRKTDIVWSIIERFNYFYNLYKNEDYEEILEILRKNSYVIGQEIYVISGNEKREGKAIDISEDGELIVKFKDGAVENLNYGEVSIRRK